MPKPNVIVDRVRRLDLPVHPMVAAQGNGVPAHATVYLMGSAALLDLNDPRAAIWEGLFDELRHTNDPVYLETDPNTNVIKQVLYPQSVTVAGIALAPVGNLHEIELEISQARHYLRTTNPDYQQLLTALTVAHQHGTPVLVTENLDDHEIIDVRPGPAPFVAGPAMMATTSAGPSANLPLAPVPVSLQQAQQLFTLVTSQSYIPFKYPDDGCWGRAHEMSRLMIASAIQHRKVWIYGHLRVSTRNNPHCSVTWGWHVAPTLLVTIGSNTEIHVIDPSLFTGPVPQATWTGVQHDPTASLHDTDASVFYRSASGHVTYDSSYSQTQQVLARYRRALALRTAQFGPPPYNNCP